MNEIYVTLAYNYFNPADHQDTRSDEVQITPDSANRGLCSKIRTMMYNATEKTILGKTKEKWLFILMGIVVVVMLFFFFFMIFQRFHETSASEFTSAKCNRTGRYYVVKRKM